MRPTWIQDSKNRPRCKFDTVNSFVSLPPVTCNIKNWEDQEICTFDPNSLHEFR